MSSSSIAFLELVQHPFKYRLYLLKNLPAAFFSGLKVSYADEAKCVVTVPYTRFTTNPFRSTYFACLSMAAEMSTGILALAQIYRQTPKVSMLVSRIEGDFTKKATGLTTFTCDDGLLIKNAAAEAMATGKSISFRAKSVGRNSDDELIATFYISWSFKVKSEKSTVNH